MASDTLVGMTEDGDSAYEEYLALEELARVRHEYVRGEIYAMAGGTPEHAALAAATLRLVGNQLHAGCRTYSSDLRVRAEANDVTSYPDGTVVCGKVERSTKDPLAIVNVRRSASSSK